MAVPLKEKISTILKLIKEPRVLKFLLSQRHSGYLCDQGWFNAFKTNMPVGKDYAPLPWMTYSFIDFVKERLNKDLILFEFGSGNSTLFFAERVKKVISVEHDKKWYDHIKSKIPKNVTMHLNNIPDNYLNSILNKERADIVIVDGENRNECIFISVKALSDHGVIILDDSERNDYNEGKMFLKNNGFKKIDFWGFSPGLFFNKATTVYYKKSNCLGI
jgi:hypothetical protein